MFEQLLFKRIMIFDVELKTSKTISFNSGINIITSLDNQIGKSTIVKSLYYSLGAEVYFSDRLNLKSKIHIAEVEIGKELYTFIRHKNIVVVKNEDKIYKFSDSTSLSNFLNSIFKFEIFLESKKNTYITAPPVFYFLPYYIDQDYGWTPELKSFDKLAQFDKSKRSLYSYYHLDLLDEEFGMLQIEKKKIEQLSKKTTEESKSISSLLTYIKSNLASYDTVLDYKMLRNEYEDVLVNYKKYSFDLNNIRRKLLGLDEEIFKIENVINNLGGSIKEKEIIKSNIKKRFEIECPNCNYTIEFNSKDILKMNYNISDLDFSKLELLDLKDKVLQEKKNGERDFILLKEKLLDIEKSKTKTEISFNEILKFKGLEETKSKLTADYLIKEEELQNQKRNLKVINPKVRKWNNSIKEANENYKEKLQNNLLRFNATEHDIPNEITIDSTVSASGSGQIRVNLARVYSLLQLKETYEPNHVRLPLVIDSPKGGEQSVSNSELILSLLTKNIKLQNQVIIATIDFDSFYTDDYSEFNVITLNNEQYNLLIKSDYEKNKEELNNYLDLYYSANQNSNK